MGKDVSIVMSLSDKVSPSLKAMAGNTKAFDKSMEDLDRQIQTYEKSQKTLSGETATPRSRLIQANAEVKEAEKAWKKCKDAVSQARLDSAIKDQEELKTALNESRAAMRENEKAFKSMVSNARAQASDLGSSPEIQAVSALQSLGSAGIGNLFGQTMSQVSSTYLESAVGQPMATAIGDVLSGAVSGLAMGSFAGPMGMLFGGLTGAASGVLSGATAIFTSQDESFKSYVQDAVETQINAMDTTLSTGSATAGSREQTRLAFVQRFGGDEAAADAYLQQVKTMAMGTNYSYDEITGYSKSLLNTYAPEQVFSVLQTLSDATAGLNLNESDVNVLIQGLSRMRTTGKATQEYLNYFSERGVDVYSALADATGADRSDIAGMVTRGEISGETAAQAILDYIDATFGGLSEKLSGTYDAMVDNLADAQAEIDAAMGAGYNDARKEGIQAQQDWLSGESGDNVSEAYRAIGAFKASLENTREELERQYIDEVMNSDAYQNLDLDTSEGAAEAGRMIMEAKVKAQNEYNASEGAQLLMESELTLIDSVRNDTATNQAYYDAGYQMGQAYSKGRLAGATDKFFDSDIGQSIVQSTMAYAGVPGLATGLNRVPYDNFPALLHRDERVLTAAEARSYDAGGAGTVTVTGNQFIVRQESDIDAIAQALYDKLRLARLAGVSG